jgi:hypothetical protein
MKICVFDTETVSVEKPFCYNVGLVIYDSEASEILHREEFVVEQIWHNNELFNTAYYAEKKPLYISRMKGKKISLEKWGYITQKMARLFKLYEVEIAFAYNSGFDERVFEFNCEWFKTINPFDNIPIRDIRGFAHHFICFKEDYKAYCEENGLFTESGQYSSTAEALFRYISKDNEFIEEHTALADSEIELDILRECIERGADLSTDYKAYKSVPRKIEKVLTVIDREGNDWEFNYCKITINKDKTKITLK